MGYRGQSRAAQGTVKAQARTIVAHCLPLVSLCSLSPRPIGLPSMVAGTHSSLSKARIPQQHRSDSPTRMDFSFSPVALPHKQTQQLQLPLTEVIMADTLAPAPVHIAAPAVATAVAAPAPPAAVAAASIPAAAAAVAAPSASTSTALIVSPSSSVSSLTSTLTSLAAPVSVAARHVLGLWVGAVSGAVSGGVSRALGLRRDWIEGQGARRKLAAIMRVRAEERVAAKRREKQAMDRLQELEQQILTMHQSVKQQTSERVQDARLRFNVS